MSLSEHVWIVDIVVPSVAVLFNFEWFFYSSTLCLQRFYYYIFSLSLLLPSSFIFEGEFLQVTFPCVSIMPMKHPLFIFNSISSAFPFYFCGTGNLIEENPIFLYIQCANVKNTKVCPRYSILIFIYPREILIHASYIQVFRSNAIE